jgi:hypothetical protein
MQTAVSAKLIAVSLLLAPFQPANAFQAESKPDPSVSQPAAAAGANADSNSHATTPAQPDAVPDAELRTFGGGPCLTEPAGSDKNMAPLLATLLPQVVGAGIDALTSALDAAGRDRIVNRSTVLPLEYAVRCVQIARGVSMPSRDFAGDSRSQAARSALEHAPFLIEFYFRQSRDGSALLVTPTRLSYRETLDGGSARRPRTLYATFNFSDRTGDHASTVTVPLGSFTTRDSPYDFDPMMRPIQPGEISPLGAANSVWIPNPYSGQVTGAPAALPELPPVEEASKQGGGYEARRPPRAAPAPASVARRGRPAAPSPSVPAVRIVPANAVYAAGTAISPLSVTVVISETRPGSAFARALAGILRGSRTGIVNLSDPAQRATARTTELAAANTQTTAFAGAYSKYAQAYQDYCGANSANRPGKAPALYEAQMALLQAANPLHRSVPFTQTIDPTHGAEPYPGFCL